MPSKKHPAALLPVFPLVEAMDVKLFGVGRDRIDVRADDEVLWMTFLNPCWAHNRRGKCWSLYRLGNWPIKRA
ncbi:MAG: hypothetical protein KGL01_09600, partial [Betaproteobacteria bacterium]|nr:hypothetical protein [Betaproteobacteria bacterium]